MKKLSKKSPFYQTVLNHFRKQYKNVKEVTEIKITADNKVCAGEWIQEDGTIAFCNSLEAVRTVKIY